MSPPERATTEPVALPYPELSQYPHLRTSLIQFIAERAPDSLVQEAFTLGRQLAQNGRFGPQTRPNVTFSSGDYAVFFRGSKGVRNVPMDGMFLDLTFATDTTQKIRLDMCLEGQKTWNLRRVYIEEGIQAQRVVNLDLGFHPKVYQRSKYTGQLSRPEGRYEGTILHHETVGAANLHVRGIETELRSIEDPSQYETFASSYFSNNNGTRVNHSTNSILDQGEQPTIDEIDASITHVFGPKIEYDAVLEFLAEYKTNDLQ